MTGPGSGRSTVAVGRPCCRSMSGEPRRPPRCAPRLHRAAGTTLNCSPGRRTVGGHPPTPVERRMLEFLIVVALVGLVLAGLLVGTAVFLLRRILRSRLVVAATDLVTDSVLAVSACRPRATPNRAAALRALRVSRAHRLLRERVAVAQRAGAHLGDVPAVLPRLEAEGRRLRAALGRLVGSAAAGQELLARAD